MNRKRTLRPRENYRSASTEGAKLTLLVRLGATLQNKVSGRFEYNESENVHSSSQTRHKLCHMSRTQIFAGDR